MNSDPNDFEALCKLIALKRHEQPPPGYFSRLPDRIAARLERGEGRLSIWEKFLSPFIFRPAFVYGFSLAALGALTTSVIYSVRVQPGESAQAAPKNSWQSGAPEAALAGTYNSSPLPHMANWSADVNASNPAPIMPSFFGSGASPHAVPIFFASPP
jgi:hypothetical protein